MNFAFKILLCALSCGCFSSSSFGALTLNFAQVGPDVHVTATGLLDVAGMALVNNNYTQNPSAVVANTMFGVQASGVARVGDDQYELPTGNSLFSLTSSFSLSGTGSGDSFFYFDENSGLDRTYVVVPDGFTSGVIDSLLVVPNVNLATLNVTPFSGLSWGPGPGQSMSVTAISAIPEPSTYLAILGFAGLGMFIWRRRKMACLAHKPAPVVS